MKKIKFIKMYQAFLQIPSVQNYKIFTDTISYFKLKFNFGVMNLVTNA